MVAHAQSAIIYGGLGNFDTSNDTGKVCHGFRIDIDGLQLSDVAWGGFSANRYGAPQVIATPTGVSEVWAAAYDAATDTWSDRTVQHSTPWFPGQCYQWSGAATYADSGCEHFGAGYIGNPTRVESYWLCEDPARPGELVPQLPPTAVPWASYVVAPVVVQGQPAQVVAEVAAPEPAEAPNLYGDAQWERVFIQQLPDVVTPGSAGGRQPGRGSDGPTPARIGLLDPAGRACVRRQRQAEAAPTPIESRPDGASRHGSTPANTIRSRTKRCAPMAPAMRRRRVRSGTCSPRR